MSGIKNSNSLIAKGLRVSILILNPLLSQVVAFKALFTTGIVLQELLQGFAGPRARAQIIERFSALPLLTPDRRDHIEAAELRNTCRRHGIQVGTIDALLAQLCLRRDLTMLTADADFRNIAKHCALDVWGADGR